MSGSGLPVGADWMRQGVQDGGAPIPEQIADKLAGREFTSFAQFRSAFWKEVAVDPDLAGEMSSSNIALMEKGFAPFAPDSRQVGGRDKFELDHIVPIFRGGAVYDADNMQVMTPQAHIEKSKND